MTDENNQKWICVNFAVPSDERPVLANTFYKWTMTNGQERSKSVIHIASRVIFKNGKVKWRARSGGYISTEKSQIKVTHWMPMPESPKK